MPLESANHFQPRGTGHDASLGREFGTRSLRCPTSRGHDALELLNHNATPVIPSRGSVGASGDLAPLAHLALVLIGEGEVHDQSGTCSAKTLSNASAWLHQACHQGGLALINGTHLMAAYGIVLLEEAHSLLAHATDIAALSIDACLGTDAYLNDELYDIATIPARSVATDAGSLEQIIHFEIAFEDDPRVQEPYSLRATPTVLGSCLDQLESIEAVFARELGAVTDNPIVLRGRAISGANFHGMPLAQPWITQ